MGNEFEPSSRVLAKSTSRHLADKDTNERLLMVSFVKASCNYLFTSSHYYFVINYQKYKLLIAFHVTSLSNNFNRSNVCGARVNS